MSAKMIKVVQSEFFLCIYIYERTSASYKFKPVSQVMPFNEDQWPWFIGSVSVLCTICLMNY